MGKLFTLMVAQAMPARANMTFIAIGLLSARRKLAIRKEAVSITTPARMVFLRPTLLAMIPTGRKLTMAAPWAIISVILKSRFSTLSAYTLYLLVTAL